MGRRNEGFFSGIGSRLDSILATGIKKGKKAVHTAIVAPINSYLEDEPYDTAASLLAQSRKEVMRGRSLMQEGSYDVLLKVLGEEGIQRWGKSDFDTAKDRMKSILKEHPEVYDYLRNNF